MFPGIIRNLSPWGETFKHFDRLEAIFRKKNFQNVKSTQGQGERFGEGFKSHKYIKIIYIYSLIIIFHLFTPHTHTRDVMRAYAYRRGEKGKIQKVVTD